MGNSAIGRGTAVEENKVKASSGDSSPDFLDGKVGTSMQVASNLLEVAVNPLSDTVIQAVDEILFGDITDSNNLKKDTVQGIIDLAGGAISAHEGIFARDSALASGTQAIVGVGFEPVAVWFGALQFDTSKASWGFAEINGGDAVADNNGGVSDSYSRSGSPINLRQGGGSTQYSGDVQSMDSDGFTINWTRIGSPTGSFNTVFIAIR